MKKLIICSKFRYESDLVIGSIAWGVVCSVSIIATLKNSHYMGILRYISCIFAIALVSWSYSIKGRKAKIEIEENELLN